MKQVDTSLNKKLAKKLNIIAIAFSIVVYALLLTMRQVRLDFGIDFSFLPLVNATINSCVAICLLFAFYYIKKKNIKAHRKMMFSALSLTVLFLLSYVLYHFTSIETEFCRDGAIKYVYYFVLITHVVLAAITLPFICFTFIKAFTHDFKGHRKMARWVFPLWLYVAITGPLVYLLLEPCY